MRAVMLDPSAFTPPYDHHLCKGLAERGVDVTLLTTEFEYFGWDDSTPYEKEDYFYNLTKRVYSETDSSRSKTMLKGAEHLFDVTRLTRRVRSLDPDVIHVQWLPLPIVDSYWVKKLREIAPVVFTVHDSNPFHGASSSRLQLWGTQRLLRQFDHLIAHTEFTKESLLERGIAESDVSIVPHGVLEYPEPERETDTTDTSEQRILFFGTIKPYKGVDTLLRAFAELPESRRSETTLSIVGKPQMPMEPLRELQAELDIGGSVEWDLRFVPDTEIPSVFSSADLVVFPYREIDQSGALMSALPFGKPIVATNVGGFSEVLTDGEHGFLADPEDHEQLAEAMERVLSNPDDADRFGDAVKRLAETTYSWEQIAKQTIETYESARTPSAISE